MDILNFNCKTKTVGGTNLALTEYAESVVDGDHDDLTETRQNAAVEAVTGAELVAFAMNKNHYGKFVVVRVAISWRCKRKETVKTKCEQLINSS